MAENPGFEEFVAKLRTGDREAWEEFCKSYIPVVERKVAQRFGGREGRIEPASVALSVMTTFWDHVSNGQYYLDNHGGLVGLLCTIAVRKALKRMLRLGRVPPWLLKLDKRKYAAAPEAEAEAREFTEHLNKLLASLTPVESEIFDVMISEKPLWGQLAKNLGCTDRWIRTLRKRIQEKLRELEDDRP